MKRPFARRTLVLLIALMVAYTSIAFACSTEMVTGVDFGDYGKIAYEYLEYIDENLPDRDAMEGRNIADAREWIISELKASGYALSQIQCKDFTFSEGKRRCKAQNIIVTLPGRSQSQIIVGAHYDNVGMGSGAGDNGSGVAVVLEAAHNLIKEDTLPKTVVFIFFSGEEYGFYGSADYARGMTKAEIKRTEFMVNIDSILCGDFCYLYGGTADFRHKTVTDTQAFEKVYAISQKLGLDMRLNPWTFENPPPGFDEPDYPSPSTGDWSDHVSFVKRGIQYVYMEASNWDIPGEDDAYDGSGETAEFGEMMHTKNDTLAKVEEVFPGRALYHLQVFSMLLHAVLTQE